MPSSLDTGAPLPMRMSVRMVLGGVRYICVECVFVLRFTLCCVARGAGPLDLAPGYLEVPSVLDIEAPSLRTSVRMGSWVCLGL